MPEIHKYTQRDAQIQLWSHLSLSLFTLILGQACEFSAAMAVNIGIVMSAVSVFPHYSDTHSADVKIKMLIVFIPIEPPTRR